MPLRVLIFDLDLTLVDEYGILYPGLEQTLRDLKELGYRLFVCSYNPEAEWIINHQGIREYFEQVIVNLDQEKGETIVQLLVSIGELTEDTLFFDDDRNNIVEAIAYGLNTYHVPRGGLTPYHLKTYLPSLNE